MSKCGIDSSTFILTNELDCSTLVIPDHITHIETTYDFDKPINKIVWSNNLISIKFGPNFNNPIDDVIFPDSVKHISFGINNNWSSFSKSLKKFYFPKSLVKYINQGPGVKESVDNIIFPDSTEVIDLGYDYNVSIKKFKFPLSIKEFNFGCGYSQSLSNVLFPPNIILNFYQTDAFSILSINTHVYGIFITCISSGKRGEITHLPPDLKILKCWSDTDKEQVKCQLPDEWKWTKNEYGIWICSSS